MKKKKIILLGLIFVLLVLLGVLVFSFRYISDEKSSSYGLYGLNSYYVTDDFKIYFINQDGEKEFGFNEKLIRDQDCIGGPYIQYYVKGGLEEYIHTSAETHYTTENPDLNKFLQENDVIQKTKSSCNPEYYFYINNESDELIVARSLYKNDAEFDEALKLANKNFDAYLEELNTDCNDCLLVMKLIDAFTLVGPYRYSTGELWDNFNYLCEIGPETLDNGREIYPVNNIYSCQEGANTCNYSANILGELFTADDCGEERIREIYGDSGNFHPFGLRIELADNPARYDFLNTLERIGFKCSKINISKLGPNEDSCSEFILDEAVKTEDLLKLKEFFLNSYFSMNDVYLEHIDYTKNYLQVKTGQSLYVSNDLNLKFIYADPDPFFEDKCIITEKGNIIENSCGHLIEVIDKDPNISAYDAIAKLIPDMNYCDIEINRDPITNFDSAYRIVPKRNAFTELDIFSDVSACGSYVSFGSGYHDIYYNEDFPNRLLITNWGGHEPSGTLEKTDGPVSFWVHTVEFF